MRRSFSLVLLFLSLGFLAGCKAEVPEGQARRIIILTNGNSPFWDAAAKGANDAAEEMKLADNGFQVEIQRGDYKDKSQIDKLKSYATAGDIAAVAISVTDDNNPAIADEMKALREAGIKVITIDSDVNRERNSDARFGYIGTDNVIAGRELGKAAQTLVSEGDYAAFVGLKGASNAQARIKGFDEGAGSGITRAKYLEDKGNDKAKEVVQNNIDPSAPPKVLVGIWSYNTPAIVETVENQGIRDQVTIVGFDADPPSIQYMNEGKVDALLVQNPYDMGYLGVKALHALATENDKVIKEIFPDHGSPEGDVHTTGLKIVVPDAEDRITKDLFREDTEFMTLSEFEDWLKKYGLTGS